MSLKHLAAGSPYPVLTRGTLRVYSMKYCPFDQRVKLVMAHKNIQHETVNINLKSKPEWYYSKNPFGLVPTLEQDGKLIHESTICMDYLEDSTPGNNLYPKDPYLRARMRLDMKKSEKFIETWFKLVRCKDSERAALLIELNDQLSDVEGMVKGRYMEGDTAMMIDYFLWPWFERLCVVEAHTGTDPLPAQKYPKLTSWYSHMVALSAVQTTCTSSEAHITFDRMCRTNSVNYDFEL